VYLLWWYFLCVKAAL